MYNRCVVRIDSARDTYNVSNFCINYLRLGTSVIVDAWDTSLGDEIANEAQNKLIIARWAGAAITTRQLFLLLIAVLIAQSVSPVLMSGMM